MKVLHVSGSDTSAMDITDTFGLERAYKLTEEHGGRYTIAEEDIYAVCRIHDFGQVDPNFINFIKNNFIDYDFSKGEDFFCFHDDLERTHKQINI